MDVINEHVKNKVVIVLMILFFLVFLPISHVSWPSNKVIIGRGSFLITKKAEARAAVAAAAAFCEGH